MKYKSFKNVRYYSHYTAARLVAESLRRNGYPMARVVEYTRGHAIQYRISGAYSPTNLME